MKRNLSYIGYWLIQLTWGCIMTTIGLLAAAVLLVTGHKPYFLGPNMYFIVGKGWGGVNLGPVFIVSEDSCTKTTLHEAGHGLQNLIWGPLFPFVIAIPSVIRYYYFEYVWRTDKEKYITLNYDAIWFEGQATRWGCKVFLEEMYK